MGGGSIALGKSSLFYNDLQYIIGALPIIAHCGPWYMTLAESVMQRHSEIGKQDYQNPSEPCGEPGGSTVNAGTHKMRLFGASLKVIENYITDGK